MDSWIDNNGCSWINSCLFGTLVRVYWARNSNSSIKTTAMQQAAINENGLDEYREKLTFKEQENVMRE